MRISEVKDCVKILINDGIIPKLDFWSPYNYSDKRILIKLDKLTKRYSQKHINEFIDVYMLKNIDITAFDYSTRKRIKNIWTKIHDVKWVSWEYLYITSFHTRLRDFVKILYDSETQLVKFMYDCGWLNDYIYDVYRKAIISYVYSDSEKETLIRIIQVMLQLLCVDILDEDIVVDMDYAKQIATKESYPWNLLHDIGEFDIQDCFDIKNDIREEFTKLITDELDLRPKEAESIKLRYIEMLTFSEIGDVIGVSKERVVQILAKGRRKLLYHPVRLGAIRRLIYNHSADICKQAFAELEGNLPIPVSMVHFSLDVLRYIQQYKGIDTCDNLVSTVKGNPSY